MLRKENFTVQSKKFETKNISQRNWFNTSSVWKVTIKRLVLIFSPNQDLQNWSNSMQAWLNGLQIKLEFISFDVSESTHKKIWNVAKWNIAKWNNKLKQVVYKLLYCLFFASCIYVFIKPWSYLKLTAELFFFLWKDMFFEHRNCKGFITLFVGFSSFLDFYC